jgi:septin family protein
MPLSVIASQDTVHVNGKLVRGREYSWGVAEGKILFFCKINTVYSLLFSGK